MKICSKVLEMQQQKPGLLFYLTTAADQSKVYCSGNEGMDNKKLLRKDVLNFGQLPQVEETRPDNSSQYQHLSLWIIKM